MKVSGNHFGGKEKDSFMGLKEVENIYNIGIKKKTAVTVTSIKLMILILILLSFIMNPLFADNKLQYRKN